MSPERLREIADLVGQHVQQWSYQVFTDGTEELAFSRVYDGEEVTFSVEPFDRNERGDLHICVDVRPAHAPVMGRVFPSYVFWKLHPDLEQVSKNTEFS